MGQSTVVFSALHMRIAHTVCKRIIDSSNFLSSTKSPQFPPEERLVNLVRGTGLPVKRTAATRTAHYPVTSGTCSTTQRPAPAWPWCDMHITSGSPMSPIVVCKQLPGVGLELANLDYEKSILTSRPERYTVYSKFGSRIEALHSSRYSVILNEIRGFMRKAFIMRNEDSNEGTKIEDDWIIMEGVVRKEG